MQETKLGDPDAPVMTFAMAGYQLVHHGEGRWNGVAIAAREGMAVSTMSSRTSAMGLSATAGRAPAAEAGEDDFDPFDEARMVAATIDGLRIVSLYAPNGRVVGSPFYAGKLAWFERLARWITAELATGASGTDGALVVGGDLNVAPTDATCGTPRPSTAEPTCREPERVAFRQLLDPGWPTRIGPGTTKPGGSRGGTTEPATSTRTSGCGSTTSSWRRAWRRGSSTRRSTAKPARVRRRRPTMPRS